MVDATLIEVFSVISGGTSLVLALLSIVLAISSERRSNQTYRETAKALAEIEKRAALTETVVSEQAQRMMGTLLTIAEGAVVDQQSRRDALEMQIQRNIERAFEKLSVPDGHSSAEFYQRVIEGIRREVGSEQNH